MSDRSRKFKSLLQYWRTLVARNTENRMAIFRDLTIEQRSAIDNEHIKLKAIIARISALKTRPVTPNPIFV